MLYLASESELLQVEDNAVLTASLLKYTLILLLFVVLPIALMRLMVYKTIEVVRKDRR